MISLCFECRITDGLSPVEIEALQRDIWKKCDKRGLGGFFVRDGAVLLGHFEGETKAVFGCIETMIRKPTVTSGAVLSEVEVPKRGRGYWSETLYLRCDLAAKGVVVPASLAQASTHQVEAGSERSQRAEV